ncbi:HotDog domain-containing protein [Roridomyces roridus]|uniref:HotDog domain-containing protein n=1 Tax=Roridomyces roridus TaxID=1738132 RepID=A0AAD7AZU1_9AGAR|nr:HotDog domain-containing protein [Roridomyces roridus]
MASALLRRASHASRTLRRTPPLSRSVSAATSPSAAAGAFRPLAAVSLASAAFLGAYALGSLYPPAPLALLYPQPAPPPPADPNSPAARAHTAALESALQSLPQLTALRTAADSGDWYEMRPHTTLTAEQRSTKLTAGALHGPGRLALFPLSRVRRDESEQIIFTHLGRGLCGHDGIIHGGLLGTLLDESLVRQAVPNLPAQVGVTATLSLSYRAPTKADQFVVIRTQLVKKEGRKAIAVGRIETLDGTLLVEGEALVVQPRDAQLVDPAAVRANLGAPPEASSPVVQQVAPQVEVPLVVDSVVGRIVGIGSD